LLFVSTVTINSILKLHFNEIMVHHVVFFIETEYEKKLSV